MSSEGQAEGRLAIRVEYYDAGQNVVATETPIFASDTLAGLKKQVEMALFAIPAYDADFCPKMESVAGFGG